MPASGVFVIYKIKNCDLYNRECYNSKKNEKKEGKLENQNLTMNQIISNRTRWGLKIFSKKIP